MLIWPQWTLSLTIHHLLSMLTGTGILQKSPNEERDQAEESEDSRKKSQTQGGGGIY